MNTPPRSQSPQPTSTAAQARLVDQWNQAHGSRGGVPVIARMDDGREVQTATRSTAYLLGGHTAAIILESITFPFSLERVRHDPLRKVGLIETPTTKIDVVTNPGGES